MTTRRMLDVPNQTTLANQFIAAMQGRLPDWAAYESDPGVYWADIMAQELITRIRAFNTAADANWINTATGAALEDLVLQYGVIRMPGETDEALRLRAVSQFAAASVGTPEQVLRDARAASDMVADASYRPDRAANEIDVWITAVPAPGAPDDIAPSMTLRTTVANYLNDDTRRLIWIDQYNVQAPTVTAYTVTGTVTYARGKPNPVNAVNAALDAWLLENRTLNTRIATSAIAAAMFVDDVIDVDLTAPAADLPAAVNIVYNGARGTLTFTEET